MESYQKWMRQDWSRQAELSETLVRQRAAYSSARQLLETARKANKDKKSELANAKKRFEDQVKSARENIELCQIMLKRIPSSNQRPGTVRGIDVVLSHAESLLDQQKSLAKKIDQGLAKANSVLAWADVKNKIAVAWAHKQTEQIEKLKENEKEDLDQQKLARVDALSDLLTHELPMLKDNLSNFLHNTGQNISRFYIGLKDVSKGISRQSARISQAVSKDVKFNAISDISLKLISRIDELEFWNDLEKFNNRWEAWVSEGQVGLPPKEIDDQLVSVAQVLSRSNTKTGLNAVFDYP